MSTTSFRALMTALTVASAIVFCVGAASAQDAHKTTVTKSAKLECVHMRGLTLCTKR